MSGGYREWVQACIHPQTYKYYFPREQIEAVWRALQRSYGPAVHNPGFGTIGIQTPALIFRSTAAGNPITVFRRRKCRQRDIDEFHALVGFHVDEQAA